MDQQTADFYETNASSVAQRYEAVQSPVAHLFPLAFAEKSRVLDIGCGSGRDMAGLAAQGFSAFGLEPSPGLRAAALASHPELDGRIAAAALPDIGQAFEVVGDEAVGPGRGSAVGALTCYCLGITDVDPIEHDLLFSRFLSPARGGKQMKLRFTIDPVPEESDFKVVK